MAQRTKYLLAWLALLPAFAAAQDYRSVAVPRAAMLDAPSASAKKRFSVTQYYPVEVIVNLNQWVKVRDKTGDMAWIESAQLANLHTVIALEQADVLAAAETGSAVVFRVEKDVVLEWLQAPVKGWVKVKHKEGLTGYIAVDKVWGL